MAQERGDVATGALGGVSNRLVKNHRLLLGLEVI